jgi:prepilin peptidase CpaA
MFYLILLTLACIYISTQDVCTRRIANGSLIALFLLQTMLDLLSHIYYISGFAVFLIGFGLFWKGWIAAGDIKLASVLALAVPLSQLPTALVFTGLIGGIVSLCYLMINYGFPTRKYRQDGIPYGVAISFGFYLVIVVHQVPLLLKA